MSASFVPKEHELCHRDCLSMKLDLYGGYRSFDAWWRNSCGLSIKPVEIVDLGQVQQMYWLCNISIVDAIVFPKVGQVNINKASLFCLPWKNHKRKGMSNNIPWIEISEISRNGSEEEDFLETSPHCGTSWLKENYEHTLYDGVCYHRKLIFCGFG